MDYYGSRNVQTHVQSTVYRLRTLDCVPSSLTPINSFTLRCKGFTDFGTFSVLPECLGNKMVISSLDTGGNCTRLVMEHVLLFI